MTITKLQRILVGVLAVQLVLAIIVLLPRPGVAGTAGPLLGEVKAEDIVSLTIRDDQGKTIKLAKVAAGWVLPEAADYPVDATKVTPVLAKLVGIKTNRLATQTAASHSRLQVADDKFVRKVDITTSGGASKTLYLGTSAGTNTTHARLAGQNEVYLASGISTWDLYADASSWIDTLYINVPQADVTGLTMANANGQFTFARDAGGNWTMEGLAAGETFNTSSVPTLLNQAAQLRMTRPLSKDNQPAYGLDKPVAVLTLKTKKDNQEKTITLTVGARDAADSSYVVKSSDSAYYVRVSDWVVKDLVEKKRDGFLQLPPTPTPTATPKS
jgi:hypothetical protein